MNFFPLIRSLRSPLFKSKFSFSTPSFPKSFTPFPIANIRSFGIIAHIDHGKSTLADRMLEITGTITPGHNQYLDKLKVEQERGITVKAQSAVMYYSMNGEEYLLNLIDTPGHVDFNYEVTRALVSCKGVLLLVDCTQGVQAQTISNFELAKAAGVKIIPVLNKIDVKNAEPIEMAFSVSETLDIEPDNIHMVSAKTGLNVKELIEAVIREVPPPLAKMENPLCAFLIDNYYLKDKGVVLMVEIRDGFLSKTDTITSCSSEQSFDIFEIGILNPEMKPQPFLTSGMVGYVVTNMKSLSEARVGDTFYAKGKPVQALPGFKVAKPMVFAGIYSEDPSEFNKLENALDKLRLSDPSVTIEIEASAALGQGFRCGFLGLLHMEIFVQRLEDEHEISTIQTLPTVTYRVKLIDGEYLNIENALAVPPPHKMEYFEEPMVEVTIIFPKEYFSLVYELIGMRRGTEISTTIIHDKSYFLKYKFPLAEIISNFNDKLKSITAGYGSMEYIFVGYEKADIKILTITVMGDPIDALSFLVHKEKAEAIGRSLCLKLKDSIPRQLFTVIIQAKLGSKIIAREEVQAFRKDVTARCYGGDYSRKKKLLDRQKEGKKLMRSLGKVEVNKETFRAILKND